MTEALVDSSQGGGGQDGNQMPTEEAVFEVLSTFPSVDYLVYLR